MGRSDSSSSSSISSGKALDEENFEEAKTQMLDSRWANQVGNRAVRLSNAMETGEWV